MAKEKREYASYTIKGLGLSLLISSHVAVGDTTMVLEEIIVTAQKKSESLAEVPMTVNVITGQQFSELASFDFRDLDRMTAGISVTGENFDVNVAVRGLGTDLNAAISPRVTIYWDGAFSAQARATFVSQFDLERFELLRGPQGTLYGQSSPAGALTIQSMSPNMEVVDGYIQQSFTERDGINSQFGVSLPLVSNTLAVRIAGVYDQSRAQDIHNATLDIDNEAETSGGRIVVAWVPTQDIDVRFSYNYVEADKDIDSIVEGNGLSYRKRTTLNEFAASSTERHRHAVLEANWNLPNDWLLTSVTGNLDTVTKRYFDTDHSAIVGQNQYVISDIDSVTNQELRLQSIGNNELWDWTIGGFYQESTAETPVFVDNYRVQGIPAPDYVALVTEVTGPSLNDSRKWALFTHNAFNITEQDTVTVGIRYSEAKPHNRQTFQQDTFLLFGEERVGPVAQSTVEGIPAEYQRLTQDAWTGTLKYQHNFTDDMMGYMSYDRGWRGGSVNIAALPIPAIWAVFDDETSDNFEVGLKWTFQEGRGLLNLAAYYQLYNDFHYGAQNVTYVDDAGDLAQNSPVVNADEVLSQGVEAELNYLLLENWSITASLSYNNTEFKKYSDAPCNRDDVVLVNPGDFATCDLKGEPAGTLPEWSAVIISEYSLDMNRWNSEWYLRGLLKAEDRRWDPDVNKSLSGYAMVDIFSGLRTSDGRWDVSVWAKNLFDTQARLNTAPTLLVPDYSAVGSVADDSAAFYDTGLTRVETLLAPRTVGMTARFNF